MSGRTQSSYKRSGEQTLPEYASASFRKAEKAHQPPPDLNGQIDSSQQLPAFGGVTFEQPGKPPFLLGAFSGERRLTVKNVMKNCELFGTLGLAIFSIGAVSPVMQAAEPAPGEKQALPVREIIMYSSGVALFERAGELEGETTIDLRFKTEDINDLLKSMVVQGGGGFKRYLRLARSDHQDAAVLRR